AQRLAAFLRTIFSHVHSAPGYPIVTITEALRITQSVRPDASPFAVTLACGFTPLHLQTFLTTHLQKTLPDRKVIIHSNLYGNLVGTVESLSDTASPDALAIALKWADL